MKDETPGRAFVVRVDILAFTDALAGDTDFDPKQFKVNMTTAVAVDRLRAAYQSDAVAKWAPRFACLGARKALFSTQGC